MQAFPLGDMPLFLPPSECHKQVFPHVCRLTVAVDGEGCSGGGDLVVADLAVLRGAVLVGGLHLQDAVVNLALCHRRPVLGLPEHRGKLIHVVDLDVHHSSADSKRKETWKLIGLAFILNKQFAYGWNKIVRAYSACIIT